MRTPPAAHRLVILYGIGGLSDVGRHALQVALTECPDEKIDSIRVLTQHPELLEETNWECGCPEPHNLEAHKDRFTVVPVTDWNDHNALQSHFEGCTAVISCLGNRQPGWFQPELKRGWISHEANRMVVAAMQRHQVQRAVVITSLGIAEDWPPMEFHWGGKILGWMFQTNTRAAVRDLTAMEQVYRESPPEAVDYLLVRPVGISEDCPPVGQWWLQKQKYEDAVGSNMAKMDVARYMVQEALHPTRHRSAAVIGSEPPPTSST